MGLFGTDGLLAPLGADGVGTFDVISGTPGDDVLTGTDGADQIEGHGGDDAIAGGAGDDLIDGGLGDDVLGGGSGADTLQGGKGADALAGGSGDDLLGGGGGGDRLDGGGGADSLSGGNGVDSLSGGDGNDLLAGGLGSDTLDGGAGFDTASFAGVADGVRLTLYGSPDVPDIAIIGADQQTLWHVEALIGSDFADTFSAYYGADRNLVDGAGGDDTITGGGGDTLLGGDGADALFGGYQGRHQHLGHAGVTVDGGAGDDTVSGMFRASDLVQGGGDDDTLYWSGHKAGGDTLDGGAGNDTVIFNAFSPITADLEAGTASAGGGDDVASLIGVENLVGSYNYAADHLSGDDQVNRLTGTGGADVLTGRGGADVFVYQYIQDSMSSLGTDLITDLTDEDAVDLSKIDADQTTGGDDAFHLVGAFTGHAGELVVRYDAGQDLTTLLGDVNGDGSADLTITASGDHHDFTNFVL